MLPGRAGTAAVLDRATTLGRQWNWGSDRQSRLTACFTADQRTGRTRGPRNREPR